VTCTTSNETDPWHWITLNEPWCSSLLGYGNGVHAREARRWARMPSRPPTTCCSWCRVSHLGLGRPQPNHHRGGTVSVEANKTLVRRYFDERWNARNYDIVDELTAVGDAGEHKTWVRSMHAAFSEYQLSFGEPVAEGDRVVLP
jgi:hypothetical protein